MDIIDTTTIAELTDGRDGPCVTIYMPTHRSGRETRQGPIRLGNLLDDARAELVELGMRSPDADSFLSDAADLRDDEVFWQHQEDGLAVFVDAEDTRTYRLPSSFDEMVVVGEAFHVKPLWPVVSGEPPFFVLAMSRNAIRLLWGDRYRVGDVHLPEEIPTSLAEALWFYDPEKQLQHHAADRAGRRRVVAEFHGHGVPEENDEAHLERYLRAVDGGVRTLIGQDDLLLLAGVDELTARFRSVSQHPAIVDESIPGNPDETPRRELHDAALEVMAPLLTGDRAADVNAFHAAGDRAVSTIPDAVGAALAGRVASIFVPLDRRVWGEVAESGMEVEVHDERQPGDRDLLDLAGVATWSSGGTVHAVPTEEVPGDGPVAALLRY